MLSKVFKRAFSTSGSLFTWGQTTYGWGRPATQNFYTPGQVEGFNNVTQVASGPYHMTFLTADSNVYSVGYGANGRLGNGSDSTTESPERVSIGVQEKITQLSCGTRHSLALTEGGDVYSWGYAGRSAFLNCEWLRVHSPLGQGLPENVSNNQTPAVVEYLSGVKQVAAGNDFSIALDSEGKVWGWGDLSRLFMDAASLPIEFAEINEYVAAQHTSVRKIGAAEDFIVILLDNGRMYALGHNPAGACATRQNDKIITDIKLQTLTKINDKPLNGEKIVDFEVSGNSLILRTQSDSIYYSGMHSKFMPTRFPSNVGAKEIWATYDSVGIIGQDNKVYFVNDPIIDDHDKYGEVMVCDDPNLEKVWKIGGSHRLRFALTQ